MKSPLISIVTPSFNQANFIEKTIDSVLSQRYKNVEYVIIDGGSKDGSVDIIKRYSKYLTYWVSEQDRGQSNAINKGLRVVSGEVVNWLNSDDYLQQGALSIIGEYFSNPAINILAGRSNIIEDGKIIRQTRGTDIYKDNLAKTLGWARIDQPETYFRRKILERLGLVDEELHYVMDREFWMRYLIYYGLRDVVKIPDILVNFRHHEGSKTVSHSKRFELESNALMYQFAATNECIDLSNKIRSAFLCDARMLDVRERKGFRTESNLSKEVINYFFLYKADEAYYKHDRETCRLMLTSIKPEMLDDVDRGLFNKLWMRCLIPVWLTKLARR